MSDELFERQRAGGATVAARQLAAIGEETRLSIMVLLHAGGPQSVTELAEVMGKPFPNVSHHLQALSAAGWVESAKAGREQLYRVRPEVRCDTHDLGYLGGFILEGFHLLMLAPPVPEVEPEPERKAKPKSKSKQKEK